MATDSFDNLPDGEIVIEIEDLIHAQCADVHHCTIANALRRITLR